MATQLSKKDYERVIAADIKAVEEQMPDSIERDHIIAVLKDSITQYYPKASNNTETGIEIIAKERKRQIEEEGYSAAHDDKHDCGELADAAACYLISNSSKSVLDMSSTWDEQWLRIWPFDLKYLKLTPEDRIRELAKGGAFVAAEIDRLKRLEGKDD